jgi:hypothetical protein
MPVKMWRLMEVPDSDLMLPHGSSGWAFDHAYVYVYEYVYDHAATRTVTGYDRSGRKRRSAGQ